MSTDKAQQEAIPAEVLDLIKKTGEEQSDAWMAAGSCGQDWLEGFDVGAAWAYTHFCRQFQVGPIWIKANDRLPDPDVIVIIRYINGDVQRGHRGTLEHALEYKYPNVEWLDESNQPSVGTDGKWIICGKCGGEGVLYNSESKGHYTCQTCNGQKVVKNK